MNPLEGTPSVDRHYSHYSYYKPCFYKVEITTRSSSLEPMLRGDKPDFTGYNMKSFDQNH
jgi:hypothetical protein